MTDYIESRGDPAWSPEKRPCVVARNPSSIPNFSRNAEDSVPYDLPPQKHI
ncbi:MAG: hypothetical protein SPJ42_01410 [Oscillospiraceae bacterium]|nr:hypothetical protein [Oscillospiraceae bacterium]